MSAFTEVARLIESGYSVEAALRKASIDDNSITADKIDTSSLNPVVQIVRTDDGAVATGTKIMPFDDSIPQNTEGDEYISVTITPKLTTNKLTIEAGLVLNHSGANAVIPLALFKDSDVGALTASIAANDNGATAMAYGTINYEMAAGSTAAITFKIRAGGLVAGTTTFNGHSSGRFFGGVMNSYIKVTETMQ